MRARSRDERGMVTAELAACLPALLLVLAVALSAVSVVAAKVRVQDAAREAARAAARGDAATGRRLAAQAAPGASVVLSSGSDDVTAVVSVRVHPMGPWLPTFTVTERAVAAREPVGAGAGAGDMTGPAP
ncbi:TadE family type IV pilus minor pilin [uncultured Jatrophihabitans sp.]|uniref:TadE family type IV pilus minor pilin n=1 Tax=uncultured Jatrophihabitans sp. TaxID=1610747 RepID=UPI0035CB81CF